MSGLCEYKPGARIPESGVKAGSKQDPKTFKSSSNLDKKKCSSIAESDISLSPVFFSLLSQVLKTGQEIG